jgi:hypothetical protein
MKAAEDYCRDHPGVQIVKVGHGVKLMDIGDTAQP